MTPSTQQRIYAAGLALVSLLAALIPFVLRPVCGAMPDGRYMSCHYSGILVTVLYALLVLWALLLVFQPRQRILALLLDLYCIVASLAALLIPRRIVPVHYDQSHLFGLCKKLAMPCHQTFGLLLPISIILILVALLHLIKLALDGRQGRKFPA